ncbi:MAG TPA: hypothetical protein VF869_05955 [Jatrophihabitantaceae bacterium]
MTKSIEKRPMTPRLASSSAAASARSDRLRILAPGRKAAAVIGLARWTAEHLVVCRQNLDAALGAGAQLHARTPEVRTDNSLLDYSSASKQGGQERLGVERVILRPELPDPLLERGSIPCVPQVDQRVSPAAHGVIELHDRLGRRSIGREVDERGDDVVERAHVGCPTGMRNACCGEHFPAPALRTEVRELGMWTVDGYVERHGKLRLEWRRYEWEHDGVQRITHEAAKALYQPRTFEDLLGERPRRRIADGDGNQAAA